MVFFFCLYLYRASESCIQGGFHWILPFLHKVIQCALLYCDLIEDPLCFPHSQFQGGISVTATNCPPDWTEFTGPFQLIMWKKMMHVLHTSEFPAFTTELLLLTVKNIAVTEFHLKTCKLDYYRAPFGFKII